MKVTSAMSMSDIGDDGTATVVIQQQRQHQQQDQQQQATLLQQQQLVNLNIMPVLTSEEEIISIPKELILISLVSQEQALYNPKHENYRNAQHKDGKWLDIADNVGWTETQCKSKWKAMRDQYCRELKRSKFNAKANVKWKYFKELEFLRPYALSRNYRPRHVNSTVNNNNNSNNNNIIISNNSMATNNNNNSNHNLNNVNKFASIKIEPVPFGSCDFNTAVVTTTSTNTNATSIKNEPVRLLTPLTDEQLNSVIQQQQQQTDGNWNYLTTATTTLNTTNIQQQQQQSATSSDDALYSAFVNCVAAVAANQNNNNNDLHETQQQHLLVQNVQQTPHTTTMDEEDDDPIHTFLNIESYFEKELIAMIQQHDILYNRYNPNYRNVKRKLEVWDEIARKLKKTVKQCRLKWKAFRDQYIREHKRLKNRENAESLPRWKHYDALSFLQKYIKHKSNDSTEPKSLMQISKTALNITDMDEQLIDSSPLNISPLRSPTLPETLTELHEQQQHEHDQLQLHTLPSLTGPHTQQQQQQECNGHVEQQQLHMQNATHDDDDEAMCVVGTSNGTADTDGAGSVTGYDEMDIDTYIIGDDSEEPTTHDNVDGDVSDTTATVAIIDEPNERDDDVEKDKSPTTTRFVTYSQHSEQSISNQQIIDKFDELKTMTPDATKVQLKIEEINVVDVALDETLQQATQHQQQNFVLSNNNNSMNNGNCNATTTTANTAATLLLNDNTNNNNSNNNSRNSNNNNNSRHISIDTTTNAINNLSNGMPTPNGISPNINAVAATVIPTTAATVAFGASAAAVTSDDDEVGAFFKAVAMKIRNAKMSPIAFTDLQIEILRVINGSLRQY